MIMERVKLFYWNIAYFVHIHNLTIINEKGLDSV